MNIEKIEALAQLMSKTGLSSLELEEGEEKLKLKMEGSQKAAPFAEPVQQSGFAAIGGGPAPEKEDGKFVLSPTVGVFYAAASPDSNPFVQVGSEVKKGDVLCLIEAMKLMNEITAEEDGTIKEILVGNGQVVEYDQPLFRLE